MLTGEPMGRVSLFLLLGVLAVGCDEKVGAPPVVSSGSEQVRPLHAALDGKHLRAVGDVCGDASDCATGVCLHVDVRDRLGGRRCSEACDLEGTTGCSLPTWACVETYPGANAHFCVPREAR